MRDILRKGHLEEEYCWKQASNVVLNFVLKKKSDWLILWSVKDYKEVALAIWRKIEEDKGNGSYCPTEMMFLSAS